MILDKNEFIEARADTSADAIVFREKVSGLSYKDKIDLVGTIGEICVAQYMRSTNEYEKVFRTDELNKYDRVCDVVAVRNDGTEETIEVKSKSIIRAYNVFPLEESQWAKFDRADHALFVSIPMSPRDKTTIYYVPRGRIYKIKEGFGKSSRPVRWYPLDQLTMVAEIDNLDTNTKMFVLNVSSYKDDDLNFQYMEEK